ncbi:MAG: hypothetical protein V4857_25210 [Pseudomonadota bacterium]
MYDKPGFRSRKLYAMRRMFAALGRAIATTSAAEKERASRWSAAWGMLAGIRGKGVRLRRSKMFAEYPRDRRTVAR